MNDIKIFWRQNFCLEMTTNGRQIKQKDNCGCVFLLLDDDHCQLLCPNPSKNIERRNQATINDRWQTAFQAIVQHNSEWPIHAKRKEFSKKKKLIKNVDNTPQITSILVLQTVYLRIENSGFRKNGANVNREHLR